MEIISNQWIRDAIHAQRERFHRGEAVDETIVRPVILRSWQRCREMGVDPEKSTKDSLSAEVLREHLERYAELVSVAGDIMDKLYTPIRNARSFISLSDADGVVLHALWDPAGNYPIPSIVPGNIASEAASGTNAIGTCIAERMPVTTLATEHYCKTFRAWFCTSAPIWGARNELLGVLTVSVPSELYHAHTMGMMESTAYAIGEQMRLRALLRDQKAIIELLGSGVIVLEENGTIRAINNKACRMLRIESEKDADKIQNLISSPDIVQAILSENARFTEQEAFFQSRGGSFNYMLSVVQPLNGAGRILSLRESDRVKEAAARVTGAKAVYTFDHIVGNGPITQNTLRMARLAAQSDVTTLILGESGTGKELFAQAIHNAGQRANRPFVVVNCGALPRGLVQSELFGYDEGSFTGASRMGKPGKFELADNGTIFLDEIGEMPLEAQVTLLRLLQNGEVTRVGGKHTRHVNVRVLAATNRNLEEAMQQNTFREDLYYRLNVFVLQVPPLRARVADIRPLTHYFLHQCCTSLHRPLLGISEAAIKALEQYAWPGNIRELENIVERMVHMAQTAAVIDLDMLPEKFFSQTPPQADTPEHARRGLLFDGEKDTILRILRESGGNIRATAKTLGISRSGLYIKMRRHGLAPNDAR